jgi:hypothetical protein
MSACCGGRPFTAMVDWRLVDDGESEATFFEFLGDDFNFKNSNEGDNGQ